MVYGGNVATNNASVNTRLADVNRSQTLEASVIIPQKAVNTQKPHHAKITQHFQDIAPTIVVIPISSRKLLQTLFLLFKNLNNPGFLNQSLQVV